MSYPPTVFVVDDDDAIREALEMYLKLLGVSSRSFASAEEFLEAHQADWRGCLLLDLRMPGLGGLGLLDELQKRQNAIPTAIMTAHSARESVSNLSAIPNVFATLLKPFSVEQLKDVIGRQWSEYNNAKDNPSRVS